MEGTLRESSSKGKYSEDGRPPPRDMRPGVLRNFAAFFRELPLRIWASWEMISTKGLLSIYRYVSETETTHDPIVSPLAYGHNCVV